MSGTGDADDDAGGSGAAGPRASAEGAGRGLAPPPRDARRAERLLRWYPRAWREHYGAEFAELLLAEMAERPRSATRTADVVRSGIVTRLALAGLAGTPVAGFAAADPRQQVRVSLGTLGAALAVCLAFGAAMWSQLAIAWEWTAPSDASPPSVRVTIVMSAAILACCALAVLAVAGVGYAIARNFRRRLAAPLLTLGTSAALLAFGGHHFLYQWPGSGGHGEYGALFPVIPAGPQAFAWSLTYWFDAGWVHWSWLAPGPGGWDLAWMAASPLALAAAGAAAVTLVRRAEISPRMLAYETRLAALACVAMGVFLGGCGYWVYAGRAPGLAHAGQIDIAATALLALALAVAYQAHRAALSGLRLVRG